MCFKTSFFLLLPQQFREETIAVTNLPSWRTMAEIEVPDYKISRTIPSGSTVSLFPDNTHLHNMADVETKILFPENVNNWKEAMGNDNYWFVAYTMREYKKLAGDNVVPKQLKGDLRKVNGWEQTVLLPTSAEAINWLAYHNSQQHSQPDNDMVLVALKTTCHNLAWHTGQKLVSFCQRAHSIYNGTRNTRHHYASLARQYNT